MKFGEFIENVNGFLFHPSTTAKYYQNETELLLKSRVCHYFFLYFSIIFALALWFFIYYPEPLYYNIEGKKFQKDVPSMFLDNPFISLGILILINIIILYLFNFLFFSFINHKILIKLSEKRGEPIIELKAYRNIISFSFLPLLFMIPLFAVWLFCFERIGIIKPLYPMFDFLLPTLSVLFIIGILIVWKQIIEMNINRIFFSLSSLKAVLPGLIQLIIAIILLLIPLILNDLIYSTFVTV
ncbi:MAG: hypothetical protein ACTSR8_15105 [Promethearchaeota archaeon]